MKILILTDSLSLPRVVGKEEVLYEQTYPYLLKHSRPEDEIVSVGIGGGTIEDIMRLVDYYKVFRPDLVFIQVGIVDAAPRAFTRLEMQILRKIRLVGLLMKNKNLIKKIRNKRYTSIKKFRRGIKSIENKILELNPKSRINFIGILPASTEYESSLRGITESIELYNKALQETGSYIDTSDFDTQVDVLDDHHHLSSSGHSKIADRLNKIIEHR